MARLILVPQYPAKLRYQEWWWKMFPEQLRLLFEEVVVLGSNPSGTLNYSSWRFAPMEEALGYELSQMEEYMRLTLKEDDVLLLNDLSFPGVFPHVLFHKRPARCYAICHATSKNRYDYYAKDRVAKFPIETQIASLFTKVFVATQYHADKLKWDNVCVLPFPLTPNYLENKEYERKYDVISVARTGEQKTSPAIEKHVESVFNIWIARPSVTSWQSYQSFISEAKLMLITAKEETYGYQVIDAINNGCVPIAPNAYSYPELLPREYLYSTLQELEMRVTQVLHLGLPVPKLLVEKEANNFFDALYLQMEL